MNFSCPIQIIIPNIKSKLYKIFYNFLIRNHSKSILHVNKEKWIWKIFIVTSLSKYFVNIIFLNKLATNSFFTHVCHCNLLHNKIILIHIFIFWFKKEFYPLVSSWKIIKLVLHDCVLWVIHILINLFLLLCFRIYSYICLSGKESLVKRRIC